MKARVKATNAIVEVEHNQFDQLYCDKHKNKVYFPSDLDFDVEEDLDTDLDRQPDKSEEVTIDGWAARDSDGELNVFVGAKPEFDFSRWYSPKSEGIIELSASKFPHVEWSSDPLPVTITIKAKKK